jgi:hypothetical protein
MADVDTSGIRLVAKPSGLPDSLETSPGLAAFGARTAAQTAGYSYERGVTLAKRPSTRERRLMTLFEDSRTGRPAKALERERNGG